LLTLTLGAVLAAYWSQQGLAHARLHGTPLGNPLLSLSPAGDHGPLEGRVAERLAAGSYTYLALAVPGRAEPRWVVTLGAGEPRGTQVKVRSFGQRSDFYSRRLQRSFSELVFGIVSKSP
jgi:hypothetical protein